MSAERELLLEYAEAKKRKDVLDNELKQAKSALGKAEDRLIEFLESNSAVATARYDGIGYARIKKPRLYASCREDNREMLFGHLKEIGRDDLIKTTVMPSTLSAWVSECIENGEIVPEFVSWHLTRTVQLFGN